MTDDTTRSAGTTIPRWQFFLRPILEVLADGQVRHRRELQDDVSRHVGLTEDQMAERLDSGQRRATNRIGWAMSDLTRA